MASITSYVPIKELTNEALFIVADTSEETFPTRSITATRFANYVALQIEGGVATGLENLNAPYDATTATWRLIGRDKAYYLTPGISNVDFSYNDDQVEGVFGLTGGNSVAFGGYHNSDADGSYLYGYYQTVKKGSFAYGAYITGNNNTLNDYHYEMTVGGYLNTVSTVGNNGSGGIMYYGAVIGAYNSMPSGRASFMFGAGLIGESAYTTIVGAANVDLTAQRASSYSAFDNNRNNPAFIVGVGDVNIGAGGVENPTFVRRNGFVVKRTGDANFPELSTTMIDAANDDSAVTKGWVVDNAGGSGLEAIDEGNGVGWRLIGRDADNYGNIGLNAVDLSNSTSASSTTGAVGTLTFAQGENHQIDAGYSAAFGWNNKLLYAGGNSGSGNFATGFNNTMYEWTWTNINSGYLNKLGTSGSTGGNTPVSYQSGTLGYFNNSYAGKGSFLIGAGLLHGGAHCTVVGAANVDITNTVADQYYPPDNDLLNPAFIVGTGDVDRNIDTAPVFTRRNGFVVLRNGVVTAPEETIALIDAEVTGRVLVTKEWVESKVSVLRTKVSLTASQIKSLGTIPVDVIAASGVGTYIKVTGLEFKQNYGTAPFANLTTIYLRSSSKTAANPMIGNFADVFTGTVSNIFGSFGPDDLAEYVENEKVVIQSDADSATGDSTIDLYISYQIITL